MKDIFRSNSPESNFDFKFQTPSPPPQTKEKTPPPPKKTTTKPKVVPAQSQLGGQKWDPNKKMPTPYKDD